MPQKRADNRMVEPLPSVRGSVVRLETTGNPYLSRLLSSRGPTALDLFSGAGGMSLGFAMAGFRIVAGVDRDPWAVETHVHNLGGVGLVRTLTDKEEDVRAVLGEVGVPKVDVLIGGPPCQGFARVGRGKILSLVRSENPERVDEWEDRRNELFKAYLAFVRVLRPKMLVMENVPDMSIYHDGQTVHRMISSLKRMGYEASPMILNAADYGVPQNRIRLFIVANRIGRQMVPPHRLHTGRPVTLRQAIGDLPRIRPEESADVLRYDGRPRTVYARMMRGWLSESDRCLIYDHTVRRYAEDDQQAFRFMAEGQRYTDLPPHFRRYRSDIFDDKYHKLYWDRPSWTITAHIARDGYKYIHPDPEQVRTITVREAARIQSFPDWFRFAGFRTNRLTQIGNAVPPLLAQAIALMFREQLRA